MCCRFTYSIVYCTVYLVCILIIVHCGTIQFSVLTVKTLIIGQVLFVVANTGTELYGELCLQPEIQLCVVLDHFLLTILFTLIHVLHSCIQYVWMVNIYIPVFIYEGSGSLYTSNYPHIISISNSLWIYQCLWPSIFMYFVKSTNYQI